MTDPILPLLILIPFQIKHWYMDFVSQTMFE